MRKEIIIAIFVGIVFGGIFAFGIRRANVALNTTGEMNTPSESEQIDTSIEDEDRSPDGLSILSPEQNDVFTESNVIITGITSPDSTLIISAEDEDFIISIDGTGQFEQEIELIAGLNNVIINSFNGENIIGEEILNLVYTTELEL